MEVYVPVSEAAARGPKLAPRLDTFDGKRVGILWNHRVHGDRLLTAHPGAAPGGIRATGDFLAPEGLPR